MSIFDWNDGFLVGIRELDNQHMHLVSLLNKAYNEFRDDMPAADYGLTLIELMDYAMHHLNFESELISKLRHPDLTVRGKSREQMRHKVMKIQNYYFKSPEVDSGKLLSFMKRWIAKHIIEAREYGANCTGADPYMPGSL